MDFFLLGCILSCLLLANAQDRFNIETVLDETDFQVQQIAYEAIANQGNLCGSLSSCSPDACFRRPCWPQGKDEIQNLLCTAVDSNPYCSSSSNGTCRSLRVSQQKSYLSMISVIHSDRDFQTVLCAQKSLDTKLQQAWRSTRNFSNGWAFFGGVQGYLYVYPGRDYADHQQCDLYDPRFRPWYINALAVQKSVYILLDTSLTMSNPMGPLTSKIRLDVAKDILLQLLNTFTNGDQVAVSRIGGAIIGSPVSVILGNRETSSNQSAILSLKDVISNTNVDREPNDIGKALTATLEYFNSTPSLNVIILFTDGQFASGLNVTALTSIFEQLNEKGVLLFVYRIGSFTSSDATFLQMQRNVNMTYESVTDETNPLLQVHSYFDYIAWLRFVAVDKRPVWVRLYNDSAGLGPVITSIFPAFDSSQQLIGVASIDIVADDIISSLGISVVENAVLKRYFEPSQARPLRLVQPLPNATSTCSFTGTLTPFCPKLDSTTPLTDFICCGANCIAPATADNSSSGGRRRLAKGAMAGIIAAGIAVALVAATLLVVYIRKSSTPSTKPPLKNDDDEWVLPTAQSPPS